MTDGSLLRHLARGTEAGDEEFQLKKKILKEAAVEKHLGFRDTQRLLSPALVLKMEPVRVSLGDIIDPICGQLTIDPQTQPNFPPIPANL